MGGKTGAAEFESAPSSVFTQVLSYAAARLQLDNAIHYTTPL